MYFVFCINLEKKLIPGISDLKYFFNPPPLFYNFPTHAIALFITQIQGETLFEIKYNLS